MEVRGSPAISITPYCIRRYVDAGVAQLVEHDVANVVVVGSNPITRSGLAATGSQETFGTIMPDNDNRELLDAAPNSDSSAVAEGQEEAQRLALEVNVENRSTCERHVTVTLPREDIERYFDKEFTELMPTAHVPGFRPGRAPRFPSVQLKLYHES